MSERPAWMVPGTEVVSFRNGNRGYESVTVTEIDRVLKRDLVLRNGERFNILNVGQATEEVTRDSPHRYGRTTRLVPANSDKAQRVLRDHCDRQTIRRVNTAHEEWSREPGNGTKLNALLMAVRDMRDVIENKQ